MTDNAAKLVEQPSHCEALVWMRPGYWHKYPCGRKAKREVAGVKLCEQHAKKAEANGLTSVI